MKQRSKSGNIVKQSMKENGKCSRSERMASLLFAEKGGEFVKNAVLSSAQSRGRTAYLYIHQSQA
jgi:hypothetical protein